MKVPWRKVRVHCGSGLSLLEDHGIFLLVQLVAGQEENLLSFCWGNKVNIFLLEIRGTTLPVKW